MDRAFRMKACTHLKHFTKNISGCGNYIPIIIFEWIPYDDTPDDMKCIKFILNEYKRILVILLGYGEMGITLDFDSGISGSTPAGPAN